MRQVDGRLAQPAELFVLFPFVMAGLSARNVQKLRKLQNHHIFFEKAANKHW